MGDTPKHIGGKNMKKPFDGRYDGYTAHKARQIADSQRPFLQRALIRAGDFTRNYVFPAVANAAGYVRKYPKTSIATGVIVLVTGLDVLGGLNRTPKVAAKAFSAGVSALEERLEASLKVTELENKMVEFGKKDYCTEMVSGTETAWDALQKLRDRGYNVNDINITTLLEELNKDKKNGPWRVPYLCK